MKYLNGNASRTKPVLGFIPDDELRADVDYLTLLRDLNERQIEFAKARVMYPGRMQAAKCLRMVAPDLGERSAGALATKADGGEYEHHQGVRDLIEYLVPLWQRHCKANEPDHGKPLTLDEILLKWEADFRATNDAQVALTLGEKIIKHRGLDKNGDIDERVRGVEIPQSFIDSLDLDDPDAYLNRND